MAASSGSDLRVGVRSVLAIVVISLLVLLGCGSGGKNSDDDDDSGGPEGTFIRGRVIDTNAFVDDGEEIPIRGVTVSFLGEDRSTTSNRDGVFVLDKLDAGSKVLDMDASTARDAPNGDRYSSFREMINIEDGENEIERPFYLPRIDSDSTTIIDPSVVTVVTNPNIGVTLTVPAGSAVDEDGEFFTGAITISEVPAGLAPAALPEDLDPGLLFTIQPVGVRFNIPAPVTVMNNLDNYPPGSELDLWSLDPDTGVFVIVGLGRVSADGLTIETIDGGVRAADWHLVVPPRVDEGQTPGDNDGDCQKESDCPKDVGSFVDPHNGRFREYITLPSYVSQNTVRRLEFVYASDRAYPMEVMTVAPVISARSPLPDTFTYEGILAGQNQGYEVVLDASTLNDSIDETFRIALPLDGTELPTNAYVGQARITSNYIFTNVSARLNNDVNIINDIASEFGAGWRLVGLDRIYPAASGGVLLVDSQGMARRFRDSTGSGSIVTIVADATTFNEAPLWEGLLDEMGLPSQFRSVFEMSTAPQISMDDIAETSLFVWTVGQSFPYFGFAADTVEERSNTLTVLEAAVAQGVPILASTLDPSPRDTGFFINPSCCVREPETTQQENLTGLRRSSNWEPVVAPLGSQRLWQLLDPGHPIFNGPFGTIAPDPAANVPNGLGVGRNFSGNTVRPQLLGGSEVPLVRAYQDNGITTALTNEFPVVLTEHPPLGTRTLVTGLTINSGNPPVDPFIATLAKNSVSWLMSGISEPGQLISPDGDTSVMTLNEDGTHTRRLKNGFVYNFDADGLLQATADRNDNMTSYEYDEQNRLVRVTDPVGKQTRLAYANGKLVSVTGPAGRVTTFNVDAAGDLALVTFPDETERSFAYDARHLMTSQTDPRGFTNTYEYNSVGHAIGSTQSDGSVRSIVPSQSIGLVEPSAAAATSLSPAPIARSIER